MNEALDDELLTPNQSSTVFGILIRIRGLKAEKKRQQSEMDSKIKQLEISLNELLDEEAYT